MPNSLCVMTLNCKGLRNTDKQLKLVDLVLANSVDVLFIQESHFVQIRELNFLASKLNFKFVSSNFTNSNAGVAVLYNTCCFSHFAKVFFEVDFEGRVAVLHFRLNQFQLSLACIYAPVNYSDRRAFLSNLPNYFANSNLVILGGDFNFSMVKAKGEHNGGKLIFDPFMNAFDLIDAATVNGSHLKSTFFGNNSQSKLDRIYVTKSLCDVIDCIVQDSPSDFTDHCFVLVKLDLHSLPVKGRSYWKLNPAVLADANHVENLHEKVSNSVGLILENFDAFKEFCRDELKAAQRQRILKLNSDLKGYRRTIFNHFNDRPLVNALLKDYDSIAAEIRSRSLKSPNLSTLDWRCNQIALMEKFETTGKLNDRVIESLLDSGGIEQTSVDGISDCLFSFYSNLFCKAQNLNVADQNWFLETISPVADLDLSPLGERFTTEEFSDAVKSLRLGTTPGLDGLAGEFYKIFWQDFGAEFTDLVNSCFFDDHPLPASWHDGATVLLPKANDTDAKKRLENWRPITLLNVDIKIIASVLVSRLENFLHKLLPKFQFANIKGRSCHLALIQLVFMQRYCESKNLPLAIISLDQTKAFDHTDHDFLFAVLRKFGIPQNFVTFISKIYENSNTKICFNGFFTDTIVCSRGVRQGCPLSPVLYSFYLEPFLRRLDLEMKGVLGPIPRCRLSVFAFADDISGLVNLNSDFDKIDNTGHRFTAATGSQINLAKSEGVWLGAWANRTDSPLGIKWTNQCIKILGVYIGNNTWFKNYDLPLREFLSTLKNLPSHFLSYRDRVQYLHRHLFSKLLYRAFCYAPTPVFLRTFQREIFRFIWGCNTEPLRREILYLDVDEGGLGLWRFLYRRFASQLALLVKFILPSPNGDVALQPLHYFLLYWSEYRLRNFIPVMPNMPRSFSVLPDLADFYKIIQEILQHNNLDLEQIAEWDVFSFYSEIVVVKSLSRSGQLRTDTDFKTVSKFIWLRQHPAGKSNWFYKFFHNILPLNDRLKFIGIVRTDRCQLCNTCVESAKHCFFDCSKYALICWEWYKKYYKININLEWEDVSFVQFRPEFAKQKFKKGFLEVLYTIYILRSKFISTRYDTPRPAIIAILNNYACK